MNKTTPKKRGSWIITVPLIGAAVAYVMLWFLPTQREMDKLRDQIELERNFITNSETLKATLVQTRRDFEKAQEVHQAWIDAAPDDRQVPQVHEAISRCVRDAGAQISRFDPQPRQPYETLEQLPVILGAQGGFEHIFTLLANLEELPQTVWLEDIKVTSPKKAGEFTHCQVKLAIFAKNSEKSD
jgi:Tfp pilus assembly protein PilO